MLEVYIRNEADIRKISQNGLCGVIFAESVLPIGNEYLICQLLPFQGMELCKRMLGRYCYIQRITGKHHFFQSGLLFAGQGQIENNIILSFHHPII